LGAKDVFLIQKRGFSVGFTSLHPIILSSLARAGAKHNSRVLKIDFPSRDFVTFVVQVLYFVRYQSKCDHPGPQPCAKLRARMVVKLEFKVRWGMVVCLSCNFRSSTRTQFARKSKFPFFPAENADYLPMPPTVSIIIPCYNEEKRVGQLLEAIFAQTYPHALLDVTIADGHSTDRTREVIADFARIHPDLRFTVIDNDAKTIPAALNRAIEASNGEIILRLDGHSGPYPDYVEKCVAALEAGKAENVGGVWEIRPGAETWVARSIAVGAAHPLGVGDALYRHAKEAAYVDTVPFGAWRRVLVEKIGGYDESLLANEDYEFNARIRQSGGKIWLDPAIRSIYFARPTFGALAQQYFRYGFWKFKMLKRYPGTLRWRQALPPLFVVSLAVSVLLAPFLWVFCWLVALELLAYFGILGLVSLRTAFRRREFFLILGLPLAIATMHLAWGGGFLWSIPTGNWKS
jgi:succinoglycan biosynthesis protein ExoA